MGRIGKTLALTTIGYGAYQAYDSATPIEDLTKQLRTYPSSNDFFPRKIRTTDPNLSAVQNARCLDILNNSQALKCEKLKCKILDKTFEELNKEKIANWTSESTLDRIDGSQRIHQKEREAWEITQQVRNDVILHSTIRPENDLHLVTTGFKISILYHQLKKDLEEFGTTIADDAAYYIDYEKGTPEELAKALKIPPENKTDFIEGINREAFWRKEFGKK